MLEEKGPTRVKFFIGLTLAIFVLLVVRLAYLQIAKGDALAAQADQTSKRLIRINAPRGVFYDRNHKILATSKLAYSLVVVPEALAKPYEVLEQLAALVGRPLAELQKRYRLGSVNHRPFEGVTLAANLDQTAIFRLAEAETTIPGVILQEMSVRYYPFGEFAAHLFGYVGEINAKQLAERKNQGYRLGQIIGQEGLEKVYDRLLQGTDGGREVEVDRLGIPRRNVGYRQPTEGNGLQLTVDAVLQQAAETALGEQLADLRDKHLAPSANAGAVLALDPNTGEILAMVSQPGFDPNLFVGGISNTDYQRLINDQQHPFTNRTISGEYPVGSTFKPVVGIAALTEGKVTLDDRFYCNGYDPIYPKKKCWIVGSGRSAHGSEDIIAGFKNSCNIVFYELGRRLGPDTLAKYARMFGLGKNTGIGLPGERSGLVPDTAWKKKVYHDRWYFPETMDFAIGQGFLNMTPVQLAQVYMAIANGGTIYKPHLVNAIISPQGKQIKKLTPEVLRRVDLDAKALAIVRQGLMAVTGEGGTAHQAFVGLPVKVAGKTGSAQNSQGPSHGWFAGMAPAANPRIVVIVLVEHGTSGAMAAAPVARKVFDAFFRVKATAKSVSTVLPAAE